jgi:hypothetical protein
VKTVNIRPEDIVEGNAKLTLGLIWTIILNFQVSVIKQRQRDGMNGQVFFSAFTFLSQHFILGALLIVPINHCPTRSY